MAVKEGVYTLERYLAAGSILIETEGKSSLEEIDQESNLDGSLKPEIEALDSMNDILNSHYSSPESVKKYCLSDEYKHDFQKVNGYIDTLYGGNHRLFVEKFDEKDRENLSEEIDIVEILS